MSNRDLNKYIEEYMDKFYRDPHGKGGFSVEDINQIKERADRGNQRDYAWNLIHDALSAGFMVGYRYGQRESRKNRRG